MKESVYFLTTGCRLNQIELISFINLFQSYDIDTLYFPLKSSTPKNTMTKNVCLCIINSCCVTQKATQKTRRLIRVADKKLQNALILVTGCYAQVEKEEVNDLSPRIAVLKGQYKTLLPSIAKVTKEAISSYKDAISSYSEATNSNNTAPPLWKHIKDFLIKEHLIEPSVPLLPPSPYFPPMNLTYAFHTRASLKVQDGCDNSCSFCLTHIARGKSASKPACEIVREIKKFDSNVALIGGKREYKEVTITGVNIAQYKSNYDGHPLDLSSLMQLLLANSTNTLYRLSSLYPSFLTPSFIKVLQEPRIAPYFHLSIQAASTRILRLMNRAYTANDIKDLCKRLREVKDSPFISADIIAGFPSETEEEFQETYALCKELQLSFLHVFPYSARPGTLAVKIKPPISPSVIKEREDKLLELSKELKIKYIEECKEKVYPGVVESKRKDGIVKVFTINFLHCLVEPSPFTSLLTAGQSVKVKITRLIPNNLYKGAEQDCYAKVVE